MLGPGIELAGQALKKNAVVVMPKNQWGWYNSVIAGDFLVRNLETRIHMFLGGSPLFQIQSAREQFHHLGRDDFPMV